MNTATSQSKRKAARNKAQLRVASQLILLRMSLDKAARELTLAHEHAEEIGLFELGKKIRATRRRVENHESVSREIPL